MKKTKTTNKKFKTLRELFEDKKRWCAGAFAVNRKGWICEISSKSAVSFCLIGGVERVYETIDERRLAIKKLTQQSGACDLIIFNDTAGHAAVLELCKKAKV